MTWQAALLTALGVVAAALISAVVSRYLIRQARQANTDDRDAVWNAAYRNAVEPHLQYDLDRRQDIYTLRNAVNRLEGIQGLPLTEFKAIPEPPPLFPKLEGGKPVLPPK